MIGSARFTFICGDDEFLVSEKGMAWYQKATESITEELSKEVIDGRAGKVDEVSQIVEQFSQAIQTQSLFGEQKVVWLKAVNFISNTQTGNAKGTVELLEHLKGLLETIDTNSVAVLITAYPIYKVRSFYKWCSKAADFEIIDSSKEGYSKMEQRIQEVCAKSQVQISKMAVEQLIEKVNGNSRLVSMEIEKMTVYVGEGGSIDEKLVNELVPNFGEGDFFEATDAFFSGQLEWTLEALKRHFFTNNESRPLLGSLQSRNRLMIQLRILKDSGELPSGYNPITKKELERLAGKFKEHFDSDSTKSNLNIFTQNPFYLGRLFKDARRFSLKRLIDFQMAFADTFEAIIENPKDQAAVFNQLAIRCLGD